MRKCKYKKAHIFTLHYFTLHYITKMHFSTGSPVNGKYIDAAEK